jgi:carbamoyltransferase
LGEGAIVPFYQGRMEYGPRALGNRSILALPNSLEIKNRLNLALKKRVYYQPFCPSMLASEADRVLACGKSHNPYMTIGYRVRTKHRSALRGVINVDGTCRPQIVPDNEDTPMAAVLRELKKRTGYGVVLNTSLNVHGQPLACSPRETLAVVREMGATAAVMGEFVISVEDDA